MIDTLQLKNVKAWRDSGPITLAPVTMLLGTNSSGKSTLLQSLLLLKQTIASPDRTIHLNLGGDEVIDFFNFGDFENVLSHGTAAPRQFEIAFDFKRPADERVSQGRFVCSYGQTSSGAVAIQELTLSTTARRFRAIRRDKGAYSVVVDDEAQPRGKGRHLTPERSIALPAEAIALLGVDGAHLQDLSLAIRRELEGIAYLGPLRRKPERDYVWNKTKPGEVGSDGHKVMDALLASALLKADDQGETLNNVSRWLKRMGIAEQIEVRQVGRSSRYEVVIHKDGVVANLRDVGIGVSQVLPVLTVAYFVPPGSTVLLEEPEIHLHPLAQSVLAEMFAEVSQKRSIQFIVETHSEHLFRRMQTLIAQRKTNTTKCQMLFVERQGANAVLVQLDVDEFGTVRNWPPHFFGDTVGEAREQAKARAQRMRGTTHA
jgi:ABC-type phosphate transport system ATPase subunit